ncbi:MAG TPA: four helix bundle protein [bacterium]|nr:four helix bundle protein [bacterium]
MSENIIKSKSFRFALHIMSLYKHLIAEKEYILSKQLLRSGTSIGANVQEALAAQSRKDFLHKMAIASKEARETVYWLELLKASEWLTLDLQESLKLADELVKLLTAIVKTTSWRDQLKIKN